jgi:hypothetical protein
MADTQVQDAFDAGTKARQASDNPFMWSSTLWEAFAVGVSVVSAQSYVHGWDVKKSRGSSYKVRPRGQPTFSLWVVRYGKNGNTEIVKESPGFSRW